MDTEPLQSETDVDSVSQAVEPVRSTELKLPQKNRMLTAASWIVVLLVVIGIAGLVSASQFFMPRSMETSAAELLGVNLTAKMLVGYPQSEESAHKQIEQFESGPLEQRYGHAILVNEISGADKALTQLDTIDRAVEKERAERLKSEVENEFPTDSQRELGRVLRSLFEQYREDNFDSSFLPAADRELLEEKLGWVSKLALYPQKSPEKTVRQQIKSVGQRVFGVLVFAMLSGVFALFAAVAAIFLLLIMIGTNNYQIHFENQSPYGFVYIETFAIWIFVFFGTQIASSAIAAGLQRPELGMALSPVAFFGSLIALAWPMIRGVPFRTLRKDIGWEMKNPFVEVFVGGFSYLALLIPMVCGISVSVLLGMGLSLLVSTGEFESAGPAGHPIAEEIANGGPLIWLAIFVSACIAAPVVEETMFRGVLYRYLRDATNSPFRARWISVSVSCVVGALMFAMIHPQGLVGIPVLMTLAIGFSLVREWRNSLIGPVVMHAINNSMVTCLLIVLVM